MSQTYESMDFVESSTFKSKIHLFLENTSMNIHNRCMLKSLNNTIA